MSSLPTQAIDSSAAGSASFARLDRLDTRVFITEKEINFLSFPLPADSRMLFDAGDGSGVLRDNRLGQNVRLEQEKIGFSWIESALAALSRH